MSFTHPVAEGRDKFYYLTQMSTLASARHLAYSTSSIGWLGFAMPLALLLPLELALKSVVFVSVAALLYLVVLSVERLSESLGAAVAAAVLLATSNLLSPLVTEFVAELVGLTVFAFLTWLVICRGAWNRWVVGLVALSVVAHRSALIWSALLISPLLVGGIAQNGRRKIGWCVYVAALGLMTLVANEVSASAGLPVLQSGWSWASSTFRESAAVALALLLWNPHAELTKRAHLGIAGVGVFALWNPFLFSDPGFNTVGPRLALVAVWLLALSAPVAVIELWRSGRRLLASVVCVIVVLVNSWPRRVETVSPEWIERREVLEAALSGSDVEFSRQGIHVAEHGIQFLLRFKADLDARQSVTDAERDAQAVWYWLSVDGQSRPFAEGYWIAAGWVQVPWPAIGDWLKDASETERIRLVTQNLHLRSLVREVSMGASNYLMRPQARRVCTGPQGIAPRGRHLTDLQWGQPAAAHLTIYRYSAYKEV